MAKASKIVPRWRRWLVLGLRLTGVAALLGIIALVVTVYVTESQLPSFDELKSSPNGQMIRVLADDGIHDLGVRITPVDCVAAKGGVVAMRPLLVHASSKSRTEMPRRVLHIEYAASDSIADPLRLAIA